MINQIAGLALAGFWGLFISGAGPEPAIVNPGFEQEAAGGRVAGWDVHALSVSQGYKARVSKEKAYEGSSCLEITGSTSMGFGVRGIVYQVIPADGLRGKRIRFRAAMRAEAEQLSRGSAALWLRAVRPDLKPCPFVDMADRPVRRDAWTVQRLLWMSATMRKLSRPGSS